MTRHQTFWNIFYCPLCILLLIFVVWLSHCFLLCLWFQRYQAGMMPNSPLKPHPERMPGDRWRDIAYWRAKWAMLNVSLYFLDQCIGHFTSAWLSWANTCSSEIFLLENICQVLLRNWQRSMFFSEINATPTLEPLLATERKKNIPIKKAKWHLGKAT